MRDKNSNQIDVLLVKCFPLKIIGCSKLFVVIVRQVRSTIVTPILFFPLLGSTTISREKNIVIRAAFVHVLGDLLQSVGVLVAAIIIMVMVSDLGWLFTPLDTGAWKSTVSLDCLSPRDKTGWT